MVLVDTSVWVRALFGQDAYKAELDHLLATRWVAGHELIYGELLIGDRGGGRKITLANYELFPRVSMVPHSDVVALVRFRKLHGRGIGWVDAHLLASAITAKIQLWTADAPLAEIAKELGVAYK